MVKLNLCDFDVQKAKNVSILIEQIFVTRQKDLYKLKFTLKNSKNIRIINVVTEEFLIKKIVAQKPFKYIVQNLESTFGEPKLERKSDALTMLVKIVLSQATSDANSERTFQNLKNRFGSWEEIIATDESEIADAIRLGGLANQKALIIKELLKRIKERHGIISLEFVDKMTRDDAREYLSNFRGIGPKTVACTLLFALHKEVFPLDTHIFRIFKRMGILPEKISDAKAHRLLDRIVPRGKFYSLHVNLIRLGRKICRPGEPLCEQCPLIEYCDYGMTKM